MTTYEAVDAKLDEIELSALLACDALVAVKEYELDNAVEVYELLKASLAYDAVPKSEPVNPEVEITEPLTIKLPVISALPENDKKSKSKEIFCVDTSKIFPEFTSVEPDSIRDPERINVPISEVEFDVIEDSILSPWLPDLWIYIFPSGIFKAISPMSNEDVVGILPVVKLRLCNILLAIYYYINGGGVGLAL